MEDDAKQAPEATVTQKPAGAEAALDRIDFKNKKFLLAIAAVIVIGATVALFALLNQGETDTGDGWVLSNQKIETVDESKTVTAVIKNTSGHEETFLVGWNVFDVNGEQVGTVVGYAADLPDGASAPVDSMYLPEDTSELLSGGEEIASFELDGVSLMKEENARLQAQLAAM